MVRRLPLIIAFLASTAAAQPPVGARCPMRPWMEYRGTQLVRTTDGTAYLYVTDRKRVDADGAPNAYHPDDVNGRACPARGRGLDCPANAGYRSNSGSGNSDWWQSVLVPDPERPSFAYRQRSGPTAGYFVSQTSLRQTSQAGRTSPLSYVDASRIPYAVMPMPFFQMPGTGSMGDIGFAVNLDNGRTTPFVFADVKGSAARLGEGSIAFWQALGGNDLNPRNGAGLPEGRIAYLVFPRSKDQIDIGWPIDAERLRDAAMSRLTAFGGLETLRGCAR
jgi:hypothetical protein